jgi:hypothetical protein
MHAVGLRKRIQLRSFKGCAVSLGLEQPGVMYAYPKELHLALCLHGFHIHNSTNGRSEIFRKSLYL